MCVTGEEALMKMPALIELLLTVPAIDYNASTLADMLYTTAVKARLVHVAYFEKQKERFKRYELFLT
jgi:hypothetical protein